jgi:predicted ATP-dependent endonuclease of OLD family
MKLKKIVLNGFRSVKLEETLFIDDRVTILIGANDHGKSNLLSAIKCLNDNSPIRPEDRNWDSNSDSAVEIKWYFEPSTEDLEKLGKLGRKIIVEKPPAPPAPATETQPEAEASPTEASATTPPTPPAETSAITQPAPVAEKQTPTITRLPVPPRLELGLEVGRPGEIVFSRNLASNKVTVVSVPVQVGISSEPQVLSLRPQVELFESPSGNVLDQVNAQQLETPELEFMQGIFRLAGLWDHRKTIFKQDETTSKLLDGASAELTKILNDRWNQGKELKWKLKHTGTNGDHITIEIEDPAIQGRYTRPSLRSSGFRTYFLLSMIIYARTHNKPSNSNIYLFDEPGTYLHPSAQLDLQRSFETIADGAQIVYTTHSLFLVSKNYPERNRVISKAKLGTKIDQKPFTKNWKSVRESLGILLSNNFLIADKTLLVEGPSDIIYILDAVRKLKASGNIDVDLNDLSIVDAGDSQNYLAMAKLMLSEGRYIVALLDGDGAGRNTAAQLKKFCAAEMKSKRLQILMLDEDKSSEDVFANLDALRDAARRAYDELVKSGARTSADGLEIAKEVAKIKSGPETLGRSLDQLTKSWFSEPEKISKLLIAIMYEDLREDDARPVRWSRLSEQILRVDKWSVCRG